VRSIPRPWLVVLLLAGACGSEQATSVPSACEALAVDLEDEEGGAGGDDASTHERVSACLRTALDDGHLTLAARLVDVLVRTFDGRLRLASGRVVGSAETTRGALVDAAIDVVDARLRGDDVFGAREAARLAAAEAARIQDEALRRRAAGTVAWVDLDAAADCPGPLPPHAGPRVVAYVDDFLLGEATLPSVLARWAREGEDGRLQVLVVPVRRGLVREGVRVREATEAEEAAAIRRRLEGTGIVQGPAVAAATAAERLGLDAEAGAILVVSRDGRVVARRRGRVLDPRDLEGAVQRVAGR
jgi:hypothetical protein